MFMASAVYVSADAFIPHFNTLFLSEPFEYYTNTCGSRSIQTFLPFQLVRMSSLSVPTSATGPLFNFIKPTCYVMHHQFNIQQLYVLPALYLCVLYLSENRQRLVPLTA